MVKYYEHFYTDAYWASIKLKGLNLIQDIGEYETFGLNDITTHMLTPYWVLICKHELNN